MAVVTAEIEVPSSVPAPTLFKVFKDFKNVAPKAQPEVYKSVDIEGDGGAGSIVTITFSDGLPYKSSKHKMDVIDSNNLILSYTIFEGDVLMGIVDSATHHAQFIPSDGGSVYKYTIVFKCKGDSTLNEDTINLMKEAIKNAFKAFESYVIAHPQDY